MHKTDWDHMDIEIINPTNQSLTYSSYGVRLEQIFTAFVIIIRLNANAIYAYYRIAPVHKTSIRNTAQTFNIYTH